MPSSASRPPAGWRPSKARPPTSRRSWPRPSCRPTPTCSGPVPVTDEVERMLVRVPRAEGAALAAALQAVTRAAQRQEGAGRSRSAGSGADRLSRSSSVNCPSVAVRPIRLFGDPVLRTSALPVTTFDKELRRLVKDLTDTMRDAPGSGPRGPADRGLAAGLHLRRRRRGRPPHQPDPRPVQRGDDGRRGRLPLAARACRSSSSVPSGSSPPGRTCTAIRW